MKTMRSIYFKTFICGIFVFIGLIFYAGQAQAAIMSVVTKQKIFSLGETFLVEIHLNSESQIINAVQATITYPNDMLEVVNVSQGGSFLTLWPQEPAWEATAGIINLAGGIPNGSLVLDGKIVTVTFRAKAPGGVEIGFARNSTNVYLNDGKGTAVPVTFVSGIYNVSADSLVPISSPTHPNEDAWYPNNSFTVRWSAKENAVYSYKLSDLPNAEPDNYSMSTDGTVTFADLKNGVYYFILKESSPDANWKIVGKRRAMIDSQPPSPIQASIAQDRNLYDNKYFVIFSTVDRTSGVDHYDIEEGGQIYTKVKSPYVLRDQSQKSSIIVRAYDRAGNMTEYSFGGSKFTNFNISLNNTLWVILEILIIGLIALFLLFCIFKLRSKK